MDIKRDKRKRNYKGTASKKIRGECSSHMTLTIHDGKYHVTFCVDHSSHPIQVEHLRIANSLKRQIVSKLKMGVKSNHILRALREEIEQGFHSIISVDRKDIENLVSKRNAGRDYRLDDNDGLSVHKFVEQDNGKTVIWYKPMGVFDLKFPHLKVDDFALAIMTDDQREMLKKCLQSPTSILCMDSTHGSGYDILLTTLMSGNSFGNVVPCAFLFTTREDEFCLKYFFQQVKSAVGNLEPKVSTLIEFKCLRSIFYKLISSFLKIFMTDDAAAFWNSFSKVMDSPNTKRLLCSRHVDKNWRKKLSIIKDETTRAKVYKMLSRQM